MTDSAQAAWLVDSDEAGVCFIDQADIDDLVLAGRSLGLAVARIDLADCRDKAEALQRLASALHFPDWFGGNWDALADSLDDLSWWPAPGYLVVVEHFDDWQLAQPDDVDTLLDIFDTVALQWSDREIPFWLMLPLPGQRLAALPTDIGEHDESPP